jgi:hypothetical protein
VNSSRRSGFSRSSGVAPACALPPCRLPLAVRSPELTGLRPRFHLLIPPSRWPAPRPIHSQASVRPTRRFIVAPLAGAMAATLLLRWLCRRLRRTHPSSLPVVPNSSSLRSTRGRT